jgi:hypothetical protein
MRTPRRLRLVLGIGTFLAILWAPVPATAQASPNPGEPPEEAKPWTYYLAFPLGGLAVIAVLGMGMAFFRHQGKFFGREEPPPQVRRRPQFAPAAAGTQAGPPGQASGPPIAASPVPAAPPTAPERPAPEPAAEEAAPAQPEAAPARPTPAPAEHVEPDQEVYDRELQAQLDKGADRRVAEGRAKAAAVRAARAAGGPKAEAAEEKAEPEPEAEAAEAKAEPEPKAEAAEEKAEPEPEAEAAEAKTEPEPKAEEKAEAEAATEEKVEPSGKEAKAEVKEPEVVEQPTPVETAEAEEAEEPKKVAAPRKEAPAKESPPPQAPPGADQETFERVLNEQLEKGLARPIAEGRARAAAIKAARDRAGAG